MMDEARLIEADLLALAETGVDLRDPLFERFFIEFPDQADLFINREAASRRMTDETLQMLHALAAGETWVETHIASFIDNHRNYGHIPSSHYARFTDLVVEVLCQTNSTCNREAWQKQADALKVLIARWADYDWRQANAA